jgi:hypothetical protein
VSQVQERLLEHAAAKEMRLPPQEEPPIMKIVVYGADGAALWERQPEGAPPSGMTSRNYASDGTLDGIVGVLEKALAQAQSELRRVPDEADAVPN